MMEPTVGELEAYEAEQSPVLTTDEKIDYIFNAVKKLEGMETQLGPMLAGLEKSPIFKMMGFKK